MLSQNKAAEKYGTTISVVQYWLKTKDKILAEYYSLAKGNVSGDVLKLRFGENLDVEIIPGEDMPRKASAEEMKKENRVLREKVEYFEDMVAYLDELYVLLNKDAMGVWKRRFEAIAGAIGRRGQESVRRLCGLAGVSPKCYYAYRRGRLEKHLMT